MKQNKSVLLILLTGIILMASACSLKFERNPDDSIRMEVGFDEASMQTHIQQSINDPQVREFHVELQDGFVEVSGERENVHNGNLDTMRFRLDLGAANGHMTAVISEAFINDHPLHPDWLETWNANIAENLASSAQNNPNSSFEAVTVTVDEVLMVWRIEPQQNQ